MQDKDEIIKRLIKSKVEIIADRNERFAMILDELEELRNDINKNMSNFKRKITKVKKEGE